MVDAKLALALNRNNLPLDSALLLLLLIIMIFLMIKRNAP